MSHTWKFLPIAALFALGAFMLLPGGAYNPQTAGADQDCSENNNTRIIVTIIDNDTGDPLEVAGTEIEISPDPYDDDGSGSPEFVDNEDEDDDSDTGVIELEDICGDDGAGTQATFDVEIASLPAIAEDCELDLDSVDDVDFPTDGGTASVQLEVDCDGVDLEGTPTATSTSPVGPAATINVNSSNNNLGCGATSIVTITVLDSDGDPVAAGTIVNIVADRGSVSPASGQTTADGSVFVFYTASNTQGGEATITAASGSALGTTEIDVDCNTAPTQAPPPTQSTGGSIQPPNTGDGGLSTSNTWQPYAGVALILSSVITTLAVIRPRA